jgi:hypothetical protein
MKNNGSYPSITANKDTPLGHAIQGQSMAQSHSAMPGSTSARVPQHSIPPQLMVPLFPVGNMLSNVGNIVSSDLYAQMTMNNGQSLSSLPTQNAFQQMVFPPNIPGPASFPPDAYGNKRDKSSSNASVTEFSASDRAKHNRDRNREHARTTRLRKKAYVTKLKDLVEGLHSQRTEDNRQRIVAIQHLSEVQGVRRNVVRTFLNYFSSYERDDRKWVTLIEDKFWFKEPVTPYRSFRRAEIEKVRI